MKKGIRKAALGVSLTVSSMFGSISDPTLGEISMFAGNFAPRGWAFCEGQLLAISTNTALFSILGTMYGGDGRTTFALPDLRGRVPVHAGQGPGLTNIGQGAKGGSEKVTPSTQTIKTVNSTQIVSGRNVSGEVSTSNVSVPNTTEQENRHPFTGVRYIIALQGIYPTRN